ncbi:GntR family transcriptional regulator [Candidatus Enterococcus ikei]|uniref:GntR family transcriptional regulator n=1 Tax=Candidatus Enterococcus ikei TaxID=2815326 RepID=A0ABS3GUU4_9ENTE|nr:GntR family transcriptional regulator [Enterococcus sp. DIV0869a]MBO0439035.1 GntR family transcriptional regulator [Enterococcus sp. DIV0869a]
MENNRSKEKAALYAGVYNKILKMIQEGMYPEGSKLLTEPTLAKELNVSRSTLRQSLALLQEDGIIEARRGVGNFVRKTIDINATGLEKMDNPVKKSCTEEIATVQINIVPGISTQYTEKIFNRKMSVVLAVHRYYKNKNKTHAYCFSHIATDYNYLNQVDLNNEDAVLKFLEEEIYEHAHSKKCEIKTVQLTDNLKDKNIDAAYDLFQLVKESIVDMSGNVVAINKFYIPIEKALLKVFASN